MEVVNTIRRSPKNKQNPYAQIARVALRDQRLSWKARGILAYLLTNADDWKIYVSELEKHSDKDGRDSTGNGVKELMKYGYVCRARVHDEKGKFAGYQYEVSDIAETGKTVNGLSVNGSAVNGLSVNGSAVNGLSVNGKPVANKEEQKERTKETVKPKKEKVRRFSPPTIDESCDFFKGKGEDPAEGEKFFYFYESKNWYVGKNKMKNWCSAASGWISRNKTNRASQGSKKEKNDEISTIEYD